MDDLAAFGRLHVDREAPLAAVVRLEIEVRAVAEIEALRPQHAAPRIAGLARLDLDHVGAEVAEHHRADRTLLPDRPVEDANPFERQWHASSLPDGVPRRPARYFSPRAPLDKTRPGGL